MDEYIKKSEVLCIVESAQAFGWSCNLLHGEISDIPPEKVEAIRYAAWIEHHSGGCQCSACWNFVPYSHKPERCEKCGAYMDGGKDI
jgi:hypothetical protein